MTDIAQVPGTGMGGGNPLLQKILSNSDQARAQSAGSEQGRRHKRNPFVVHFKGETKAWMKTYFDRFVL